MEFFRLKAWLPKMTFHPKSIPRLSVAMGLHKRKEIGPWQFCASQGHLPASGIWRLMAVCR